MKRGTFLVHFRRVGDTAFQMSDQGWELSNLGTFPSQAQAMRATPHWAKGWMMAHPGERVETKIVEV